jgi:hypothetical protein
LVEPKKSLAPKRLALWALPTLQLLASRQLQLLLFCSLLLF